jgi:hypothetical protein
MSNAAAQDETEDRYYTQVDAGDVRLFTLDQLDAAFNAGLIHENTYVCLEGESEWLTLGEVAGLNDEEEPISAQQPVAQPIPEQAQLGAQPFQSVPYHPPMTPPRSAAGSSAPYSVAPVVVAPVAPSLRPVTSNLAFDDDFEMMAMRPKRRLGKVLGVVAVLGVAAAAFGVVQSGGIRLPKFGEGSGQMAAASLSLHDSQPAAKPASIAPAAEPTKPEPPKEEAKPAEPSAASDKPAEGAEKADGDTAKKGEERFTEAMKAALLNKDKKEATESKHKKAARTAVAAKRATTTKANKGSSGFKSSGSAYDPLNGKL